jgi:hypothetical protein
MGEARVEEVRHEANTAMLTGAVVAAAGAVGIAAGVACGICALGLAVAPAIGAYGVARRVQAAWLARRAR